MRPARLPSSSGLAKPRRRPLVPLLRLPAAPPPLPAAPPPPPPPAGARSPAAARARAHEAPPARGRGRGAALATPHLAHAAVSTASQRARLAMGCLPAPTTDSHSNFCSATPTRETCTSARESAFSPATRRNEPFAVSYSAPHARTARWGCPTQRSDSQRGMHAPLPASHTRHVTARAGAHADPRVMFLQNLKLTC